MRLLPQSPRVAKSVRDDGEGKEINVHMRKAAKPPGYTVGWGPHKEREFINFVLLMINNALRKKK